MGFASDIELMFVYAEDGVSDGAKSVRNQSWFQRLVKRFRETIVAKHDGIFEIDLRLRPYGSAGSDAFPFAAFEDYFRIEGAAWPYERQSLVKLRAIAGDVDFGRRVEEVRDSILYSGDGVFDVQSMKAMREKQISQHVQGGTRHAKLSPGGLVDLEYLVQGLQITHGQAHESLRNTNTSRALTGLAECGVIDEGTASTLHEAYGFQRRLIDALRMVRGNASDLTVPHRDSEEFEFLARRIGVQRLAVRDDSHPHH